MVHLESLTPVLITYRYWILIPLSLLEGPTVAFVAGPFASRGYFNPYVAFAIFIAKDFIVDGMYYYVGRFARDKRFVARLLTQAHVTHAAIGHVRWQWTRHAWRTL